MDEYPYFNRGESWSDSVCDFSCLYNELISLKASNWIKLWIVFAPFIIKFMLVYTNLWKKWNRMRKWNWNDEKYQEAQKVFSYCMPIIPQIETRKKRWKYS